MKTKRKLSRYALARRLHYLALQISVGKPVKIGSKSIQIPDHVVVEEELEICLGEVDLELEVHWPSQAPKRYRQKSVPTHGKPRVAGSAL